MRKDYVVGIDPDVDKSGVAFLDTNNKRVVLHNETFPGLIRYLKSVKELTEKTNKTAIVVVEASWLISHNWHTKGSHSTGAIAKTGYNVGRNHQVGMLIVECCRELGIEVIEQQPLKKIWKGKDGKITHDEISYFVPGLPKQTNSEERDALLLAWNEANLPMMLKI